MAHFVLVIASALTSVAPICPSTSATRLSVLPVSEELFYRVQSMLAGLVPVTTPQQRAHSDFSLRAFVRCDSSGLTGTWSEERTGSRFEMALREGAAGSGFQVALEANGGSLVAELDNDMKLPGTIP